MYTGYRGGQLSADEGDHLPEADGSEEKRSLLAASSFKARQMPGFPYLLFNDLRQRQTGLLINQIRDP